MRPSTRQQTKSSGRIESEFQEWKKKHAGDLADYFSLAWRGPVSFETEVMEDGLRILFVKKLLR
jgi:hypothetical protein